MTNKKKKDALQLSTSAFEALESDFQEVLSALAGDGHLDKFRIEYERLHNTLLKSHENEKRLMIKCSQLNSEIVTNAGKVQAALQLSQEDQNTIQQLQKEIEKAWQMVESVHAKEKKARETIETLTKEISELTKLVDHGAVTSDSNEQTVNELVKQKEAMEKERENQHKRMDDMLLELKEAQDIYEVTKNELDETKRQLQTKQESLIAYKRMNQQNESDRVKTEQSIQDLKNVVESRNEVIREKDRIITETNRQIEDFDTKLNSQAVELTNSMRKNQQQKDKIEDLEIKLKKALDENVEIATEKRKLEVTLAETSGMKVTLSSKLASEQKKLQKKEIEMNNLKSRIAENKAMKKKLNDKISHLEHDMTLQKKQNENDLQKLAKANHEKNLISKSAALAQQEIMKKEDTIAIKENQKKSLENQMQSYAKTTEDQRKTNYRLEREKKKVSQESMEVQTKYAQIVEENKIIHIQYQDSLKTINDLQSKLKQQQALYEAVRADRNMYSRSLVDSKEKISEMKRKFQILEQQMEQLNDEIQLNDRTIVKLHMEARTKEESQRKLTAQLNKSKHDLKQEKDAVRQMDVEQKNLNTIIEEADLEREAQRKELQQLVKERDILGTQLIRRNDEIALLYEKIKIQQSQLGKGSVAYNKRLDEIRQLSLTIKEMTHRLQVMRKNQSTVVDHRAELQSTQKQLLLEQKRVKALSEELENPMNVHRWRKLEGTDPTQYEMILKIQTLQKRLIKKQEEVMEKDLVIKEKQKLYEELKEILKRQPGPEIAEQLNVYQKTVRKKNMQMKTMAGELNMSMFKIKENRYQFERMARELSETKKKLYDIQRDQRTRQASFNTSSDSSTIKKPKGPHFAGGGFAIKKKKQTLARPGTTQSRKRSSSRVKVAQRPSTRGSGRSTVSRRDSIGL
mmetsp:Transcript_9328/g.13812  ORF Transcript_9328/g.13812 Transcript_9328/m.13812 type:complete len:913 (+) Transcript_9328:192-2930(+)|eukprot:CAMPEP_0117424158 /NCGR_PEP_ID=MMETSP0758-20121206/4632_1 /TAXON_ID=63605 /ORGANISM="Percolomonas cosmopolitus, Strain AE-1 (ATCC 50343)" /LENGTH=912 /DNA_ID=CAMNT_0005207767 /DNA_START=112 /DNA_END=2850 /DNA_ORIENTATION=+